MWDALGRPPWKGNTVDKGAEMPKFKSRYLGCGAEAQKRQREDMTKAARGGDGEPQTCPEEQGLEAQSQRCIEASEQGSGMVWLVAGLL